MLLGDLACLRESSAGDLPRSLSASDLPLSQVRFSEHQSERLYSASLTGEDLDNFLSHSCDPLCKLLVDSDFTVRLVATRAVPPGVPISIDYETLEEDMLAQKVDFHCRCGCTQCRGHIVGSRQRANAVLDMAPQGFEA